MNAPQSGEFDRRLTAAEWESLEPVCRQFEKEWGEGKKPDVGEFAERVSIELRGRLLLELVALDLEWREKQGCAGNIAEYQARFPDFAKLLNDLPQAAAEGSTAAGKGALSAETPTLDFSGPDASLAVEEFAEGAVIGRYRIIRKLGEGSFGVVYLAKDEELNREVALKVSKYRGSDALLLAEFRREAQVLASLKHDHIVRVFEAWEEAGRYFVASELITGPSLKAKLEGQKRLSPQAAATMALQIAKALVHAHQGDLVHRDVKPANILFDEKGSAVLVDFGVALSRANASLVKSFAGTPQYMSPEQAAGGSDAVDARSDLYSLGVVLYEVLTGKPPHQAQDLDELVRIIQTVDAPPPRILAPDCPPELDAICSRCLARRPLDRFPSATDLVEALDAFLKPKPVDPSPPPMAYWIAATMVLAMVVALILWRPWENRAPQKESPPVVSPSPVPPKPTPPQPIEPARVERAELHIQRGGGPNPPFDALLLVENGSDVRVVGEYAPMARDDRFVLIYRLSKPAAWHLVHVDPDNGSAVVGRSATPQRDVRIPEIAGVSFNPNDRRGVNILLFVVGELPKDMTEESLATTAGNVSVKLDKLPVLSRTRAGLEPKSVVLQLPQDYLRDFERQLPSQLKLLHALFLRTVD